MSFARFCAMRLRAIRASVTLVSSAIAIGAPGVASAQGNVSRRDTVIVNRSANPVLANFRFRSIGPASMGGRIDDIAVYEKDPRIIYIGYATGGVFKSTNAGTTFQPIFERYGSASIGDIAVDQKNSDIVFVGTGEPNNRQTSSFGDGIYKSIDAGKTFTNVGLRETQTIARIVIDSRNSNVVYVASPGHLFGPNAERGVFKSIDGGATWTNIKFIDENTGFTDLVMDPSNSNVLFAASYQRRRTGCCFNGGGAGSALWKTENAGRTWTKLSGAGLPGGTYGRIAVDIARSNPNVVYAQIENDEGEATMPATTPATTPATIPATIPATTPAMALVATPASGGGRGGYDWCNNAGPNRGFAGGGAGGGASVTTDTTRVVPALSKTRPGLYRSENKGRTWTLVSNCNGRPLYFSQIRVDPTNDKTLFLANTSAAKSVDGGKTFVQVDAGLGSGNETVDQHAFWIDPANSHHVLRGSDAGLGVTWDQGETWEYVHTMATGLAYWVTADDDRPYNVLFGLQDNDTWRGPSATRTSAGIRDHSWTRIGGGDGFQTAVDPTNRFVVFTESQDGNTQRTDLRTGVRKSIRPVAPPVGGRGAAPVAGSCVDGNIVAAAGGRGAGGGGGGGGGRGGAATSNVINAKPGDTYRFNWNTPYTLSPHSSNIVWLGGNRVFRSSDQGDLWVASADLTKQVDRCKVTVMGVAGAVAQLSKNDGVTSYSTIISLAESPVVAGDVWAGTDDGNLQVSRDGGVTFTEVGRNITGLPSGALTSDNPYWFSRIDPSHFEPGMAYVSVDGHRSDDLKPYIFVTKDYGKTWATVSSSLPARGNVQVVREDPKNRNLLYAGTEFGLFISLDAGQKWEPFMTGYPTVRTDDILVHPRDGDLIVATHGRSIWIADDITPLQQFTPGVAAADATLFDVRAAVAYANDITLDVYTGGEKQFEGENPARGTAVQFFVKPGTAGEARLTIADAAGRTLCSSTVASPSGLQRVQWNMGTPMLVAAVAAGNAPANAGGEAASSAGGAAGGGGGRADAGGGRGGAGGGGRGGATTRPDSTVRGSTPAAATPVAPASAGAQQSGNTAGQSCSGVAGGGGRGGAGATAAPGSYIVKLTVGGKEYVKSVQVLEDRWMNVR
ncbi:MAG: hypothetical protein ABI120_23130 [Gemmatimonadaceae bacterium]